LKRCVKSIMGNTIMSFRRLQERLRDEGWFVEWKMPCCQSCAWAEIPDTHQVGPFEGQEIDLSKVLFNHEQDCEDWDNEETCSACEGDGYYDDDDCGYCDGVGSFTKYLESDEADGSLFCFDGTRKGVNQLKKILPIIEECGCSWYWDKSGKSRIEISW